MRLAFDLDSRLVVDPDDLTSAVSTLTARRGEILPLDVQLVRDAGVVELPDATVEIYITAAGDFGTLISSSTGIEPTKSGIETVYPGTLDLDEAALDTIFASDTTLEADATLQVRVSDGSYSYRSEPVTVTIGNGYVAPTHSPSPSPP